jgi:lipopolysaccharide transport system permease protein
VVWWYLEPLMYLLVFYIIRGVIFQRGEDYVGMLITGLVFWRWFDSSVRRSLNAITANAPLATQVYLPKIIFPLITMASMFRRFLIMLGMYVVFIAFYYGGFPSTAFFFPLLFLSQAILVLGVCLTVSALVPFLPDLRIIINNIMMMMFFISGIFFDLSMLSPDMHAILAYNPMAYLIDAYRKIFLFAEIPSLSGLLYVYSFGIVTTLFGGYLHHRFDRDYPKVISGM